MYYRLIIGFLSGAFFFLPLPPLDPSPLSSTIS
jgi:hypothetical protein